MNKFEAVKTDKNGFEVKTKIKDKWFTIAECYNVPGVGNAEENAKHIAELLNPLISKPFKRKISGENKWVCEIINGLLYLDIKQNVMIVRTPTDAELHGETDLAYLDLELGSSSEVYLIVMTLPIKEFLGLTKKIEEMVSKTE